MSAGLAAYFVWIGAALSVGGFIAMTALLFRQGFRDFWLASMTQIIGFLLFIEALRGWPE